MSDKRRKSRVWLWCGVAPILVLAYPVSLIPAVLIGEWLVSFGVVPQQTVNRTMGGIYAPIVRNTAVRGALVGTIQKLSPVLPPSSPLNPRDKQ